jgi:hypothetical protein
MKKTLLGFLLFSFLAALNACPPAKPPENYDITVYPPFPDGGDAELPEIDPLCRVACESLAKIGCPESSPAGRSCGSVCTAMSRSGASAIDLLCVANASTADQVRGCGGVECAGR